MIEFPYIVVYMFMCTCVWRCMCVCVCGHVYACQHVFLCIYVSLYEYAHMYCGECAYEHVPMCVFICGHIYAHEHVSLCAWAYICTFVCWAMALLNVSVSPHVTTCLVMCSCVALYRHEHMGALALSHLNWQRWA